MTLIPKYIDVRGLTKGVLKKSFGKKPLRLVKVIETVRRKYGEKRFNSDGQFKGDRYYVRLGEFLGCGKRGLVEIDKDGKKRYRPFFCNMNRVCFECFNRYKRGLRWVYQNRLLAVAEANNVKQIVFPVYTLHPEIRHYLTTCAESKKAESLNEINLLVVNSFKRAIGLGAHGGRDITGIVSVMHPFNSRNPFEPFLHFHLAWIPLKLTKDGQLKKMRYYVDSDKARKIWQRAQVQFARKHGFNISGSETNIFFEWIPLPREGQLSFKVKYIFRSLLDDIFIAVRYLTDDIEEFVWFEDMGHDWKPHLEKWNKLEDALEGYMNFPVKMVKSYGFLRNLKKHAEVLNIKRVGDKDVFKPVATHKCEFARSYRRQLLWRKKKWIFALTIRAKYQGSDWHNVPVKDVIGETSSTGTSYHWIRGPTIQERDKYVG
jgi:hypothetical protein